MWTRILKRLKPLLVRKRPQQIFLNKNECFSAFNIGDWSYGWPKILDFGDTRLRIGKYCSIAEEVIILLRADHNVNWVSTYPFNILWPEANRFVGHPTTKGAITIGHDVWIGRGAYILSGITIGDGAVIGAGAVVTKDVAPYAIVGGNPAKLIRLRFSSEQIDALCRIRWWNWPDKEVATALPLLLSPQIQKFIDQYIHKAEI